MTGNRWRVFCGIALVIAGALMLLVTLGFVKEIGQFFVVAVGVTFLLVHFIWKVGWALYLGAFATTLGIAVAVAELGYDMGRFWPLFVIAPGISFLIIAVTSSRDKWAFVPGTLVTVIGLLMLAFSNGLLSPLYIDMLAKVWPAALVAAGMALIISALKPMRGGDK